MRLPGLCLFLKSAGTHDDRMRAKASLAAVGVAYKEGYVTKNGARSWKTRAFRLPRPLHVVIRPCCP